MSTAINKQPIPPHRRRYDPKFKAYTIYRHGGFREIVWGYCREGALGTVAPITDFDIVIEGLDCDHFWSAADDTWLKRLRLVFDSNDSIEDIRAAMENPELGHVRYTFPDKCVVNLWRDYGHYGDGVARYITVSVGEPTEPPADYDVGHPEYGKQWYMGCGSLMFRPFDWANAVAAFINIIEAESKTSFKTKSVEGAVSIQQLLEEQKDQLP